VTLLERGSGPVTLTSAGVRMAVELMDAGPRAPEG